MAEETKKKKRAPRKKKEDEMMGKLDSAIQILGAAGAVASELMDQKVIRRGLFGTYSDGTIRNLPDAWNGEILSPKSKEKYLFKPSKKKKKKKNKSKKKHKIDL